jgi:DNA invertase Pin-like site-specific DNA recombinase
MIPIKAAAWYRVSTGRPDSDNQVPEVITFASHHGYEISESYVVSDTAWTDGGGPKHRKTLRRALDDAHAGKFSILVVWSFDVIVRVGPRRRCSAAPVQAARVHRGQRPRELARAESARRSERIRARPERRKAEGRPIGRPRGARDPAPRRKSGYYLAVEKRRAAQEAA